MIQLLAALAVVASAMQSGERPVGKLTVKHPDMCRTLAEGDDIDPTAPKLHGRQQHHATADKTCRTERRTLPKPERKREG